MIELPKYSVPTYDPHSMVDNERTDFTRRIPSLPEKQLARDSKIAMQLVRAQEQGAEAIIDLFIRKARLYKPGQVMFAKREALEWKRDSTMPTYEEWRNQMLGGLRPSDWDKFIVR